MSDEQPSHDNPKPLDESRVFDVVSHYATPPSGLQLKAKKEAKDLLKGLSRSEEKEDAWHKIFIYGIQGAAICLAIVFCVRLLHMVLPEYWCWLDPEQIKGMNELLFGGTIGTLFGKQLKGIVGKSEDSPEK